MSYSTERALSTLESGRVVRYHAAPTVGAQTDGLHAWGVAVLCIYLTDGKPSTELMMCAALHDAAELVTGDIPFPVKQSSPEVKKLMESLEKYAHEKVVFPLPELCPHDAAVLKLADTLEGLIWCIKTERTGPVEERWRSSLQRAVGKYCGVVPVGVIERATYIAQLASSFQP